MPDTLITHSCNSNVITLLLVEIMCIIAAIIMPAGPFLIKPALVSIYMYTYMDLDGRAETQIWT